jgi:hypothetical protein
MSKYQPLNDALRTSPAIVVMTLDEVGSLVGGLPRSAHVYSAWWHNDDPSHVQCRAWNDAGYQANPDLTGRRVTFTRAGA